MSRLTYRDEHGTAKFFQETLRRNPHAFAEKLAHYEDLEEAGRLIELPCKVDELVWVVKNEEVVPHWVDSFYVAECVTVNLTDLEERDVEVALEDFGKTVILAKDGAEADQKLAELKEGAE